MIKKLMTILLLSYSVFLFSCGKKLPIESDLSGSSLVFLDQDSNKVIFPRLVKGKIAVLGLIFTNCPDICPMITNNIQLVEKKMKEQNIKEVEYVLISFDPARDNPSILKQYAEIRGMTDKSWHLLTGNKQMVDSLKSKLNYIAIPGDTTKTPNGKNYYFFVHTDRIQLLDKEGKVRKNYKGSTLNVNEISEDVKSLQ